MTDSVMYPVISSEQEAAQYWRKKGDTDCRKQNVRCSKCLKNDIIHQKCRACIIAEGEKIGGFFISNILFF